MDIKIASLTKRYGSQVAVDGIDMQVRAGEVLGFLGPNGAGKTTTMKMICGLIAPDAGRIEVGGTSVLDDPGSVKRRIGYLPENNPLYEDMPVIDLLRFAAQIQEVPDAQLNERIRLMVQVCGLGPEKHKRIGELSKGYRQRVGMAQAMVHDPDVLILDEPTTGLDPNQIVEIRKLIKELGRAKTVILSTHILPEVEATCDRILIIDHGRIVANGSPADLRRQAQGKDIVKVTIETNDLDLVRNALAAIDGVETVDPGPTPGQFLLRSSDGKSTARSTFRLCAANAWPLVEITPMEAQLEDVFRDLTLN